MDKDTTKQGYCAKHDHYCPLLDIKRSSTDMFGPLTMVTPEEKNFLSNAAPKYHDRDGSKGLFFNASR